MCRDAFSVIFKEYDRLHHAHMYINSGSVNSQINVRGATV